MNALWFIPAIMSVFGGVGEYKAGKDMEKLAAQQSLLAEENALLEKRELDENVRRQQVRDKRVRGTALAKAAASGARLEGSVGGYLGYLDSEQGRQLDWMKQAGHSRIQMNKAASQLQAQQTKIAGKAKKFGLFSGVAGAASFLGQGGFFATPAN